MRARLLLMAACLMAAPAMLAQRYAISARVSTMGAGLDLAYAAVPKRLNVRLGGNYFAYERNDVISDFDVPLAYSASVNLKSASVLADWHPFANALRLTGGAYLNLNEARGDVVATENYTVNGKEFTPERIGAMDAVVGYKSSVAPYLALGLGNATRGRFGMDLEVGALYAGGPRVELTASEGGLIAPTADQDRDLEDGFKTFRVYPVVSLGLNVAFGPRR